MNVVAFVGKVKELPQLKESSAGDKYTTMTLEVRRNFPNSDGTYEFDKIAVTLWKGIAETTASICKPGDSVAIKGRIQSHDYEGRDGVIRSAYDIIAEFVDYVH